MTYATRNAALALTLIAQEIHSATAGSALAARQDIISAQTAGAIRKRERRMNPRARKAMCRETTATATRNAEPEPILTAQGIRNATAASA